ncbi:gpi-c transferase subunit p [Stylonychia lemnae]|uniref:Gpi-c transferase subunit p n=1 Tax=Stylonychia lemnae TaxID=5949 RepID=A0A078ASK2_STYLE|nr:gpi-c transferase subunit p [Stylonychia lemnae]|eukprot:CDW85149.1 gpi-c transferase subunit p [Stylonychia lemnae]
MSAQNNHQSQTLQQPRNRSNYNSNQIIEDVENDSEQDSQLLDGDVDNIEQQEIGERQSLDDQELPEDEDEEGNQYYDSQEIEDENMEDANVPINLPQKTGNIDPELDEQIEEEKIYSICGETKTKIQSVELYGFLFYNLTCLLMVVFLIWCYVPTSILNQWGIYYYPNKYYAIAFPTWFLVTVVSGIMLYVSVAMIHCHPKHSFKTMQDYASVLSKPKDIDIQHDNQAETSTVGNDSPSSKFISPRNVATLKKSTSVFIPTNTNGNMLRNRKTRQSNQNITQMKKESRNTYGRRDIDELKINYFAKIPDIVELPITVVNNVLYSKAQWKTE